MLAKRASCSATWMTTSDRVRSSSGSSSTVSSSSKRARAHASAVNTWLGARRATGSGSTAQRLGRERRSSPARGSWCPPGAPVGGRLSRGKRSPPQQRAWVAHRGDEAGEVCACEWPFRPGPAQAKERGGHRGPRAGPGRFHEGSRTRRCSRRSFRTTFARRCARRSKRCSGSTLSAWSLPVLDEHLERGRAWASACRIASAGSLKSVAARMRGGAALRFIPWAIQCTTHARQQRGSSGRRDPRGPHQALPFAFAPCESNRRNALFQGSVRTPVRTDSAACRATSSAGSCR